MTTTSSFLKAIIIVLLIVAFSFLIVKIPGIIQSYNMENDSENELNLEQEPAQNKQNSISSENKLRIIDNSDHINGDMEAPVQIIIYENFDCKFCADLADTLKLAREEFGDKIVIAYRHGTLTQKPLAYRAALAAECAAEQGKFWEMYDKLFYNFRTGALSSEQFKKDASDLGLIEDSFNDCLDQEKYKNKIEDQIEEAQEASAYGSPTIFINKEVLPGAYPFKDFADEDGEMQEGIKSIIIRHLNSANEN